MTAQQLQTVRKTLTLTQQGLATALGLARNTIARYEMGRWAIPEAIALAIQGLMTEAWMRGDLKRLPTRPQTPQTSPPTRPRRPPVSTG